MYQECARYFKYGYALKSHIQREALICVLNALWESEESIRLGERAAFPNALVVLRGITADDLMRFHLHAEALFYKVDGGKDGEKGIPLAAPGAHRSRRCAQESLRSFDGRGQTAPPPGVWTWK